ncbi:hypothetical protein [Burkholderia multivorans]|uniref:hypothetical protein n=1 Tax=Burkholderia multivorans TaxID=87883 RepID=UPI0011B248CA|nr:hypothetical protein [Burkholderia multivorans]
MDRLIAANSVPMAQADTAPITGTPQGATDGNPAANIPATRWPSYQYNAIQEELIAILTAAGITPDRTNNSQIASAIKRLVQKTVILNDTGAANAYTATNTPPLTSATWVDGTVQQVKIANSNTGASTYAPDGLAAIPIYGLGLQPLQGGELAVGGTAVLMRQTIAGVNSGNPICVLMECAGGAQQVLPAAQSRHAVQLGQVRTRLTANANFYINASTGSDSNNGLTSGTAWATINKALTTLQQNYDLGGFTATINVAAGSYAPGVVTGAFVGAIASNSVQVVATGAVTITNPSGGSAACFYATGGAQFAISGPFTLVNSNSGSSCAQASGAGSILNIGTGITVAFSAGSHFLANAGGILNINGNYSIANNGGAGSHYNVANAGIIAITNGITVTIGSGVGISLAFATANGLSQITTSGVTYAGSSVTGPRYASNTNSVISTNGGGASYFPGSTAGSTSTGGQYL